MMTILQRGVKNRKLQIFFSSVEDLLKGRGVHLGWASVFVRITNSSCTVLCVMRKKYVIFWFCWFIIKPKKRTVIFASATQHEQAEFLRERVARLRLLQSDVRIDRNFFGSGTQFQALLHWGRALTHPPTACRPRRWRRALPSKTSIRAPCRNTPWFMVEIERRLRAHAQKLKSQLEDYRL